MIRLLSGDCRDVLATLPAESVQCCITSPPYYALRSYLDAAHPDKHREIGSEATPDEYLATMVGVFREVRRVLRRDGTCWVNMGDSYASNPSTARGGFDSYRGSDTPTLNTEHQGRNAYRGNGVKAKDLLLMPARLALALQADGWWVRSDIIWHKPNPMPESVTDRPTSAHEHVFLLTRSARYYYDADAVRVATGNEMAPDEYAAAVNGYPGRSNDMQDFGGGRGRKGFLSATPPSGRNLRNVWTLDAEFPPELVERCIGAVALAMEMQGRADVPENAHEHVFLLTKSARYFYDADAVREEGTIPAGTRAAKGSNVRSELKDVNSRPPKYWDYTGARNLRNVWSIATHAYPEAHFATFPPELAERCIKAGTSERGCCAACGKPWQRVTEGNGAATGVAYNDHSLDLQAGMSQPSPHKKGGSEWRKAQAADPVRTTGWAPGCQCGTTETRPCVVLDCFAGAGTSLLVADRLQRDAIGIELNTAYTEMAMERCRNDAPLFTSFPPAEPPEDMRMADLFTDMAAD